MCFFFSSRRRHTRWTGDWSSDVCSSDLRAARLELLRGGVAAFGVHVGEDERGALAREERGDAFADALGRAGDDGHLRSEERRVGKEWRSRWAAKQSKQKTIV